MKGALLAQWQPKKQGGIGTHITAYEAALFPNLQRVKAVVNGEVRYVRVAASAIKKGSSSKPQAQLEKGRSRPEISSGLPGSEFRVFIHGEGRGVYTASPPKSKRIHCPQPSSGEAGGYLRSAPVIVARFNSAPMSRSRRSIRLSYSPLPLQRLSSL